MISAFHPQNFHLKGNPALLCVSSASRICTQWMPVSRVNEIQRRVGRFIILTLRNGYRTL